MTDLYALLDLPPSASPDEIRRRLDEYEKLWFYRRSGAPSPERRHEAELVARELEEARRTLLDPVKRRAYDSQREGPSSHQPRGNGPGPQQPRWGDAPAPSPQQRRPPAPPSWEQPPTPGGWNSPVPPGGAPHRPTQPAPRANGGVPGQVSTVGRRFGAYALDSVLALVTFGIGWLIWFLMVASNGQTPGKSLLGMQTVDAQTGAPLDIGKMIVREILLKGFVGVFVLSVTSGLAIPLWAWLVWDDQNQQLWDKAMTTTVLDV
jgi:uncharacterized RDD family membrane protein YckC